MQAKHTNPNTKRRKQRLVRQPPSGLLSLLATIASSPKSAQANPVSSDSFRTSYVLDFLCPSLAQQYQQKQSRPRSNKRAIAEEPVASGSSSSSASTSFSSTSSSLSSSSSTRKRHELVDKYQQGEDGFWRPVHEYTLYGSKVCTRCESTTVYETTPQTSSSSPTPTESQPATTAKLDILDSLPVGWKPTKATSSDRTTVILAISLALASAIFFLMIGCMFWRKRRRRRRYKDVDIEMKRRRRRRAGDNRSSERLDDDDEFIQREEHLIRTKQKLWARATARWRANARLTMRKRILDRSSTRSTALHASTNLGSDGRQSLSSSRSPSPISHRETSLSSTSSSTNPSPSDEPPTNDSAPSTISSPPAYIVPPSDQLTDAQLFDKSQQTEQIADTSSTMTSEMPVPYSQSYQTGHVATDDKALLAQRAALASSPQPQDDISSSSSPGPGALQSSAPVWEDEQLDDFPSSDLTTLPTDRAFPAPPLPLLSSTGKGKMPLLDCDDDFASELECLDSAEPSAPPFTEEDPAGQAASAPPLEFVGEGEPEVVMDMPSAPPFHHDDDDDVPSGSAPEDMDHPSAPVST